MARKSTIPEDILKHVPCKCCRVRNDGGGVYRVYKYSAIKLPSGKWSSDYGYLIGKILSDKGFIPNKRYLKELGEQGSVTFSDGITDVAYGQYALLHHLSNDILEKLEACFPGERAAQIYSYALIMCANGFVHIDQIDDFYQESFLSVMYQCHLLKQISVKKQKSAFLLPLTQIFLGSILKKLDIEKKMCGVFLIKIRKTPINQEI